MIKISQSSRETLTTRNIKSPTPFVDSGRDYSCVCRSTNAFKVHSDLLLPKVDHESGNLLLEI